MKCTICGKSNGLFDDYDSICLSCHGDEEYEKWMDLQIQLVTERRME